MLRGLFMRLQILRVKGHLLHLKWLEFVLPPAVPVRELMLKYYMAGFGTGLAATMAMKTNEYYIKGLHKKGTMREDRSFFYNRAKYALLVYPVVTGICFLCIPFAFSWAAYSLAGVAAGKVYYSCTKKN